MYKYVVNCICIMVYLVLIDSVINKKDEADGGKCVIQLFHDSVDSFLFRF